MNTHEQKPQKIDILVILSQLVAVLVAEEGHLGHNVLPHLPWLLLKKVFIIVQANITLYKIVRNIELKRHLWIEFWTGTHGLNKSISRHRENTGTKKSPYLAAHVSVVQYIAVHFYDSTNTFIGLVRELLGEH